MGQNEKSTSVFIRPIQIGLVVKDLDKTLENLHKIFNIGPFRIVDFPPSESENIKRIYKEENADFTAKFCFFDLGNIELEIIQPISGKSIWQDFIDEKGPGLHHIKFNVPEHEPVTKYLKSNGIGIAQMGGSVGKNAGKEWVFYDTEEKIGFAIETMNEIIK